MNLFRPLSSFRHKRGFSAVETIVSASIFVMVSLALYTTWARVFETVRAAQARLVAVALGNEQFEIARNVPFTQVGTIAGIPSGVIPPVQTLTRSGYTFIATTTVRNIDHAFDGTAGGAPDDLSPADNKLMEIELVCTSCENFRPLHFSTWIAPRDLESASTNGSLFVRVIDSGGLPVQGASVGVYNSSLVPLVNINDVTATSGILQIIDAPPAGTSYEVRATKSGYSSDQSHGAPTTTNPVLPHATVAVQTVTQVTLVIDRLAQMDFSSVTPLCSAVPSVGVGMTGAKLIATTPDIPKYDEWFSTGAGSISFNDIEWDNYTIVASSTTHDLSGVVPLSPIAITAGGTQAVQLVMVPKSGKAVMVTVKDAGTGLPVTGADVTLDLSGLPVTITTGRGFLRQTDWSGGAGQALFTDETQYAADDTNIDASTVPGTVRLQDAFGTYPATGELESSTFDTGSASNFYQFTFLPGTQAPETGDSVKFQIATGNSTTSWTYLGPDGTAGTYYNATTTDISAVHSGHRYLRYKMLLSTASSTLTPSVSDAMFTFTSACTPPGQVLFQDLANGTYDLTVSKSGYTTFTDTVIVSGATLWQEKQTVLTP